MAVVPALDYVKRDLRNDETRLPRHRTKNEIRRARLTNLGSVPE